MSVFGLLSITHRFIELRHVPKAKYSSIMYVNTSKVIKHKVIEQCKRSEEARIKHNDCGLRNYTDV